MNIGDWRRGVREAFERDRIETIVLFAVSFVNVRHMTNTNRMAFVHFVSHFSFFISVGVSP